MITANRVALTAARTAESGGRWYAEIEMNGRTFAALGDSLRDVAEKLRAKAREAGAL